MNILEIIEFTKLINNVDDDIKALIRQILESSQQPSVSQD